MFFSIIRTFFFSILGTKYHVVIVQKMLFVWKCSCDLGECLDIWYTLDHMGDTRGTLRGQSGDHQRTLRGTVRGQSRNTRWKLNTWGKLRGHSGDTQRLSGGHSRGQLVNSGNIQGTLRGQLKGHSSNIFVRRV